MVRYRTFQLRHRTLDNPLPDLSVAFTFEAHLGTGAFGRVWRVRYRGRSFALKLVSSDLADAREPRMLRSAAGPRCVHL